MCCDVVNVECRAHHQHRCVVWRMIDWWWGICDCVVSVQCGLRQQRGRGEFDRRRRCDESRRTHVHDRQELTTNNCRSLQSDCTGHHAYWQQAQVSTSFTCAVIAGALQCNHWIDTGMSREDTVWGEGWGGNSPESWQTVHSSMGL